MTCERQQNTRTLFNPAREALIMVLPGKATPELSTDQKCPHCHRWFSSQGIDSHRENCSIEEDPYFYKNDDGVLELSQCEECGVWLSREETTRHRDSCYIDETEPMVMDFPDLGIEGYVVMVPCGPTE